MYVYNFLHACEFMPFRVRRVRVYLVHFACVYRTICAQIHVRIQRFLIMTELCSNYRCIKCNGFRTENGDLEW